jgi:hypothetical protein
LYWMRLKKPSTDDVESISTEGRSAVVSTISGDGSSTPVERIHTPVEEVGLSSEMPQVDVVPNRRGNPDGGDPDGNLPRPIQVSDP